MILLIIPTYKSASFEIKRLNQKIEAGAKFVITQPIIGKDEIVFGLKHLNIPVVVEAWMSKNIDLCYISVGKQKDDENAESTLYKILNRCTYLACTSSDHKI